jgi:hypothetical protein
MKKHSIIPILAFCFVGLMFLISYINIYATENENAGVKQGTEVIGLIEGKDKKKYAAPDWTLRVVAWNGDKNIPVAKIEVKVDNSEFIEYSGPAQLKPYPETGEEQGKITAGGFTIEKEGVHFIECRATDLLGNVGPITQVELYIDGPPPVIDVEIFNMKGEDQVNPYRNDTGIFVGSKHRIYFHAFDMRSGVDGEKFRYTTGDGNFQKYCADDDMVKCFDKYIEIPNADDPKKAGWYIFTIQASDRVGNESAETAVTIYLDNKTPKPKVKPMFMEYTINDIKYTSIDNQFSVIHEDKESGTKLIEIRIDNPDGKWDPYRKPIQFSTSGEHTIYMRATDNVGNVETNEYKINIVIDPPSTTVVQSSHEVKKDEGTNNKTEEEDLF